LNQTLVVLDLGESQVDFLKVGVVLAAVEELNSLLLLGFLLVFLGETVAFLPAPEFVEVVDLIQISHVIVEFPEILDLLVSELVLPFVF
jgi:hypothetical protein